ncbi:MAG: hypothetical protein GY861_06725 [bacterium]|nr:hypothetical protein [bacterium]
MSICRELISNENIGNEVDLQRYPYLHRDGRRLVSNWFRRAWKERDCEPAHSFEPFIFTWIAFNGWAACVTGFDTDRKWREALSAKPEVCSDFDRLINDISSPVSEPAHAFYEYWPVFKAQEIRRKNAQLWHPTNRQDTIAHYIRAGIEEYEPRCWIKHRENQEPVPLDWPHTLSALYRVRCNLFHGEKGIDSEMDQRIVHSAFQVLVHFIEAVGYIKPYQ